MERKLGFVPVLLGSLALAACTPPYIDKRYLPTAEDYYRSCGRDVDCTARSDALSLEELYAVHLFGRSFHPWRSAAGAFARRGGAAVPFLRQKLAAASDEGEVASIFDIFEAMQRSGSYDVRADAALIADVQQAAHRFKDPYAFLRDQADFIETGAERPFAPGIGRKWLESYGKDYDLEFAKAHCRGCDYRDWTAGADTLPIDKLYALQRYGWETLSFPRNIDHLVAARGAEAVPFLKQKLREADRGLMLSNILSVLEMMRDTGRYDTTSDTELVTLAVQAAARIEGDYAPSNREAAQRLRTGQPHPHARLWR